MTKLFEDIVQEPKELSKCLNYSLHAARGDLESAAAILSDAPHIYIVGIGSSWNAGLAVAAFFQAAGRPASLVDASELLHFGSIPENAGVIVLSRSGRSFEIVELLQSFADRKAKVIAITNTPNSPLALQADVVVNENARFDNAVSITMYSALAMLGGLTACLVNRQFDERLGVDLQRSLERASTCIPIWTHQLQTSSWPDLNAPTYLLARGASMASCHEGRLLWEEAAKLAASSLSTGSFRHGSQEAIGEGVRVVLWLDSKKMRSQDFALASDLRKIGAKVLLIGQDIPAEAGDLVLNLPSIRSEWQFLIDIIPIQIAAEVLARRGNQDCDSFKFCSYIVADEGGLLSASALGVSGVKI